MAPVASTTWPARTRQRRWRGRPSGGDRQVVGHALEQAQVVVVVVAEGGGAAEDRDLGQGAQLGLGLRDPGLAVRDLSRRSALAEQPAAELGLRLGQDHAGAGAAGGERRQRPAGPAPTTSTSQWAWRWR